MDNSNINNSEPSQQNIIALLKHIKEENKLHKSHYNTHSDILTASTSSLPFGIHKVEQRKQYIQMSPEIVQYQVQTYQTPINSVDNNEHNVHPKQAVRILPSWSTTIPCIRISS